jgi:hypothetical protein
MDVTLQVGETAGVVWRLLHEDGSQTLVQLRKKMNGSGELLAFAIGWLAREDKLQIQPGKKSFLLQLR